MATDFARCGKQQENRVWGAVRQCVAMTARWIAVATLAVASLGKLTGEHNTFGQYGLGPGAGLLWAIGELVLAAWLVSGWQLMSARRVAMTVFGFLAGVSLVMFWQGRPTCGCFGIVEVRPLWVMLLDVAVALGLLVANRFDTSDQARVG